MLLGGVGVLLAMDLIGALMAVAAGLNPTFPDALGPQARLSAPLPMMAAHVVPAVGATRSRRGVAIPAAALPAVAGVLAFVSGFTTAVTPPSSRPGSGSTRSPWSRRTSRWPSWRRSGSPDCSAGPRAPDVS
ncbi:hypothetical protein [Nonomuraea sp. NPDC049624]|uniref:hypothetical protein n=1 Tax=Nonomuraea sp. NPDC049624 TaxID=3154354 RepID=UPI003441C5AF